MLLAKSIGGRALAAAILLGTALSPHQAFAEKTKLSLGVGAADVGTLDPHFASSTSDRTLVAWIFNALVRFAPGSTDPSTIEPDLAESWEASPDKLVWTFKLRPGVKWQKGFGEVTAEDVVFSLTKSADPNRSAFAGDYSAIEKVEALDPLTVRITLKHQVPSLLGLLANYSGGFIVPKAAVEKLGDDFKRNPVGSGPFVLTKIEPGLVVHFVAHEEYFRGAPRIKEVAYRFLNSASARDLAFAAGEVDAATGLQDRQWYARMQKTKGVAVDIFDPAELFILHIDSNKKPFDDIRVRQAVAHAVNREQIAQFRGKPFTRAAGSVIPMNNLGYLANPGLLPHDPAKAKALLAEAGYPNGLTIKMIGSQMGSYETVQQLLQAQFQQSGITLELQQVEHATWHQMIRKDLNAITGYSAARFPVADIYLTQFYHSASSIGKPTAATNFSHCDVADKEIEAARTETDPAKQIEYWHEAQRKIVAHVCAVPLTETGQVWVRRENLDWGYELKGSMSLGPLLTEKTHFKD